MAFLKSTNVLFYHPFDDQQEFTTNEQWTGFAQSGAIPYSGSTASLSTSGGLYSNGKINQAIYPRFANLADLGNVIYTPTGIGNISSDNNAHDTILLRDNTTVLSSFIMASATQSGYIRIGNISGSTIIYNDNIIKFANNVFNSAMIPLDLERFIILYCDIDNGRKGTGKIGTVSGSTINFGPSSIFTSGSERGNVRRDNVSLMSNDRVAVTYEGSFGQDGWGVIGKISGETITWGDSQRFFDSNANYAVTRVFDMTPFGDDKIVVAFVSGSFGPLTTYLGHISGISGLDLSFDTGVEVNPPFGSGDVAIRSMDNNNLILIHSAYTQLKKDGGEYVGTYSGGGIVWQLNRTGFYTKGTMRKLNAREYLAEGINITFLGGGRQDLGLGEVNENGVAYNVPIGQFSLLPNANIGGRKLPFWLQDNKGFMTYPTTATPNISGIVNYFSLEPVLELASTDGSLYPPISGHDRLALGLWTKNPSISGSTTEISGGYSIQIASSSIALGGAQWNDSGIQNVIDDLNNNSEHFLVLDFNNTSGNNWNLQTSVNGSGFIDHGQQDQGSQSGITSLSGIIPSINIANAISDQWVDELIMWGGSGLSEFSSDELLNLYNLAETNSSPMNQYSNFFPVSLSNDIGLFVGGEAEENDSLDLSVVGYNVLIDDIAIYINGLAILNNSFNLFINGSGETSDNIGLFIGGVDTVGDNIDLFIGCTNAVNDSIDLFFNGLAVFDDNIILSLFGKNVKNSFSHLFIYGVDAINDNINLFINGFTILSDNIDVFISGDDAINDSLNLFINGLDVIGDNIYLFVMGIDAINDNIDLFVESMNAVNDNIDLFVNGLVAFSDNMILLTLGKDVENSFSDLFIYGSDVINDNVNLFVGGGLAGIGNFDFPLHLLNQINDNSQFVGQLPGAISATIVIWNLNNGQNTALSLDNNVCINNSGSDLWVWNLNNLPPLLSNYSQLFYRMTGNNGETFDGLVYIDTSEEMMWQFPSDRSSYIK